MLTIHINYVKHCFVKNLLNLVFHKVSITAEVNDATEWPSMDFISPLYKQEMFVKHVCPLSLNVTVTLTFDLEIPNQ